jgi:hypothetical protein
MERTFLELLYIGQPLNDVCNLSCKNLPSTSRNYNLNTQGVKYEG